MKATFLKDAKQMLAAVVDSASNITPYRVQVRRLPTALARRKTR